MKTSISIRIMENEFQLACEAEEKEVLQKSADLLNHHLRDFRQKNPSLDLEKVIIMGALRATCELTTALNQSSEQTRQANLEIEKSLNELKK